MHYILSVLIPRAICSQIMLLSDGVTKYCHNAFLDHNNNRNSNDRTLHNAKSNHESILILDDEYDIALLIKQFLERRGYSTYAFTNPLLALDDFRNNFECYSFVVSDIKLHDMMGFEFVKLIREIHPVITVILMSTVDIYNPEYTRLGANLEVDSFLQKPFSLTEIVEIIKSHSMLQEELTSL